MSDRVIPRASRPAPQGVFETAMAWGTRLPGTAGYVCRRKLKRRQCARAQDSFSLVLADTRTGDLCVDLGANVGDVAHRMADTGADVICFEPDPAAFAALQDRLDDRPNVTCHQKAAGTEEARLLLRRSGKWSPDAPTSRTAMSSLMRTDHEMSDAKGVMVDVVDIVAFLAALDRDIRILKMDIEGAEWDVLEKLLEAPVLHRIDCIFVETHERIDPARYVPVFEALQDRAERMTRPFINLYWV